MKKNVFLLFLSLSLLYSESVIRLSDVLASAQTNSPSVKKAEINLAKVKANASLSTAWQNPEVEYELDDPLRTNSDGFRGTISVSQKISFPAKYVTLLIAQSHYVQAAEYTLLQFRAEVAYEVKRIYLHALLLERKQEIATHSLALAQQILVDTKIKNAGNSSASAETLRAMLLVSDAEKNLAELQTENEFVYEELGLFSGTRIKKGDVLENILIPPTGKQELTVQDSPQIRALSNEMIAKSLDESTAWLSLIPDFNVGATYAPSEKNMTFRFAVEIPLWYWKQGERETLAAERKELQVAYAKVMKEQDIAIRRVNSEIARAYAQIINLSKSIEDTKTLEQSIRSRYLSGSIGLTEYLETTSALRDISIAYDQAVYDFHERTASRAMLFGTIEGAAK